MSLLTISNGFMHLLFTFKLFNTEVYRNTFFPGGSDGRESACSVGDLGSIPGLEDLQEEGMATYSSILAWRIPMDRGASWATVHGVAKNWT